MDAAIRLLNAAGSAWAEHAGPMAWQASLLALLLFLLDRLLAHRVRASVRHALWCLLPIKLLLPVTFALPTSPAWWLQPRTALATPTEPRSSSPPATVRYLPGPPTDRLPGHGAFEGRTASSNAPLTGHGWLMLVTMAGWTGLGALLLVRHRALRRLLSSSRPPPASLADRLPPLAGELRLAHLPRIALSRGIRGPAVCGLLRPTILLPADLPDRLTPAQLDHVLLHELAHVKRRDLAWGHLHAALLVLYWMNPVLWIVQSRIRQVREEATDERVAVARRGEVTSYAETLLGLARLAIPKPPLLLGMPGVIETPSALGIRVRRLLDQSVPTRDSLGWSGHAAVWGLALVALPLANATEQAHPTSSPRSFATTAAAPVPHPDRTLAAQGARGVALDLIPGESSVVPAQDSPAPGAVVHVTQVSYQFSLGPDIPMEGEPHRRWLEGLRTAFAGVRNSTGETLHLHVDPNTPHRAVVAAIGAARAVGFARVDTTSTAGPITDLPPSPPGSPTPAITDDPTPRTRTYRLDPAHVGRWLDAVGYPAAPDGRLAPRLLGFLHATTGFTPGGSNAVFFNETRGLLMVRAPAAELELLQQSIDLLAAQTPALYQLESFFALVPGTLELPPGRVLSRPGARSRDSAQVLTPAQFATVRQALEAQAGVQILAAPRVTTLDGRQAQISVQDPGAPAGFGTVLDVLPVRLASHGKLSLSLGATHTVAEPGADTPPGGRPSELICHASPWEAYELASEETLLLRITPRRLRQLPGAEPVVEPWTDPAARDLVVWATARRIDPAGNLIDP